MFKEAKCPNCGARLEITEGEAVTAKCEYCGTPFVEGKEEAAASSSGSYFEIFKEFGLKAFNRYKQNAEGRAQASGQAKYVPPRPKFNILFAILGFALFIAPGVIYTVYTLICQAFWDSKYAAKH